MAIIGSFDRAAHFAELNSSLETQGQGWLSPEDRKVIARDNLGVPAAADTYTIGEVNDLLDLKVDIANAVLPDLTTFIVDDLDNTKRITFQVSGVTTATTRTWTFPDASDTFVGTTAAQTVFNKKLSANDTVFVATGDTTKELAFNLSGFTTATRRTITLPDASFTITSFATTFLDDADAASVRTTIGAQPLDATLTALAAYNTNGLLTQTAADTFTGRTISGTAGQITVTNGNGVSGNPTLSLPADVLIPTVITAPNTGLHILDTNATHDLIVSPGSNLTADRTFTLTTGDVNRTLDISAANVTISATAATILDDTTLDAVRTTLELPTIHQNYLSGYTLSNNGTDPTNDIDITTGSAADSTNTAFISLTSALTKRLDAAWAVGTNQGGLDTGAIANTTYHVHAIRRPDTGVVDVLFSTSPTAPTMPTNYTQFRRIGSIVRSGGSIQAFSQNGDEFLIKGGGNADVSVADLGMTATSYTLTSIPTGVKMYALMRVRATNAANWGILLTSLDTDDVAPNLGASPGVDIAGAAGAVDRINHLVRTNTSAQIRARSTQATTTILIITTGWIDTRGRNG